MSKYRRVQRCQQLINWCVRGDRGPKSGPKHRRCMLLTNTMFLRLSRARRAKNGLRGVIAGKRHYGPRKDVPIIGVESGEGERSKRGRSRAKGYLYRKEREFCEHCWVAPPVCTHHIVPVSKGGSDSEDNLVALCKKCHTAEHPDMANFLDANDYTFHWDR